METSPLCLAACDANGDGAVIGEVTDAVYILQFNFVGGPAPIIAPSPDCGEGESPRDYELLGCDTASPTCQ